MTSTDTVVLVIAAAAAVVTFVVSVKALKQCAILDNPIISACVALLTFIGMLQLGHECIALLIPYQALGVALLVTFLLLPFLRILHKRRDETPFSRRERKKEHEAKPQCLKNTDRENPQ